MNLHEDFPSASVDDQISLETGLHRLTQEKLIPGMAAAVFSGKRLAAASAVGSRKKWGSFELTLEDHFLLGANTKALTASLAACLAASGKMTWDALLVDYLPVLSPVMHPGFAGVTLEHLLRHQAGLHPYLDEQKRKHWRLRGTPSAQRVALAVRMLSSEPVAPPGERPVVTDASTVIAAAMLEAALDMNWSDLMRQYLFDPLGLAGGFGLPAAADPEQPWGHSQKMLWLRPTPPEPDLLPGYLMPALGVHLSILDYVRFLQMHLQGLQNRRPALLSSKAIHHLHLAHDNVAMGWGLQNLFEQTAHVHTGTAVGFYTAAALLPEHDLGMAVFANADDRLTVKASNQFLIKTLYQAAKIDL